MSASDLLVVLEDLVTPDDPVQMLCAMHANSLRAPLGWSISDNRSGRGVTGARPNPVVPRSGRTGVDAPQPDPARPAPPLPEETEPEATEPEPVEPEPVEPEPAESEPVEAETVERETSQPVPDRKPSSRESLLGRAFEWTGDQHSVLTQSNLPETDD